MKQRPRASDSGAWTRNRRAVWWLAAGLILFGAAAAQAASKNSCANVVCEPLDQCHVAGACADGVCDNPIAPNGTACDDGDADTTGDVCTDGECGGSRSTSNPCDPNPCLNDGICTEVPGPFPNTKGAECDCGDSGCSGTRCEVGPGCGSGG